MQEAPYVGLTENQPKAALYSSERREYSVALSSLVPCKRQKPKAMKRRRSSRESGCVLSNEVSINRMLASYLAIEDKPPEGLASETFEHESDAEEDESTAAVPESLESALHKVEHREHRTKDPVRKEVVAHEALFVGRGVLCLLVEGTSRAVDADKSKIDVGLRALL